MSSPPCPSGRGRRAGPRPYRQKAGWRPRALRGLRGGRAERARTRLQAATLGARPSASSPAGRRWSPGVTAACASLLSSAECCGAPHASSSSSSSSGRYRRDRRNRRRSNPPPPAQARSRRDALPGGGDAPPSSSSSSCEGKAAGRGAPLRSPPPSHPATATAAVPARCSPQPLGGAGSGPRLPAPAGGCHVPTYSG